MLRKTLSSGGSIVGDRIARFVISDDSIDRTNEQVVQDGGDYSFYLQNPIVLANHDPASPIGTGGNIRRDGTRTIADLRFAAPGISQKADEVWGLLQAGILKSVSIGFDPVLAEPMDPARPRGPQRYKKWVLCEISVVSIPAQSKAQLIDASNAKAHTHSDRAERLAKVAAVAKEGRRQLARHLAVVPPSAPLTKRERQAKAAALIEAGEAPRQPAPTTAREAEAQKNADHFNAVQRGLQERSPTRENRIIRAGRAAAKSRPAGFG